MTSFNDGPAKGNTLMLHRAAKFLRVTEEGGKFDALDQLDDRPKPTEKLHAYELAENLGGCHINARGGRGGFYPMVKYRYVDPQPSDAEMRTEDAWDKWVRKKAGQP